MNEGEWYPLNNSGATVAEHPAYNRLSFTPIKTEGIRFINKDAQDLERHIYKLGIQEQLKESYNFRAVRRGNKQIKINFFFIILVSFLYDNTIFLYIPENNFQNKILHKKQDNEYPISLILFRQQKDRAYFPFSPHGNYKIPLIVLEFPDVGDIDFLSVMFLRI